MTSLTRHACVLLVVLPLLGCGRDGPPRVVVTGTVTYQGQPIEEGEIRFYPKPGTETPMSGSYIKQGRYEANGLGGVPVGDFRVEILAFAGRKTDGDLEKQTVGRQFLPAKYNESSQLELTVAPSWGAITRDFHLDK